MKHHLISRLLDPGIVAILRTDGPEGLANVCEAIYAGGVTAMEVTLTTPGALEVIREVTTRHRGGNLLMGVGSVLDTESCRAALLAGAEFVVTPTFNEGVIRMCNRYGKPVIVGAYTPTEILHAIEMGADFAKVFPSEQLGPQYIKNVLAPMPHLPLIPTGGVTVENLHEWMAAGSAGVGIGSALVNRDILQKKDWPRLTERAAALVRAMKQARG